MSQLGDAISQRTQIAGQIDTPRAVRAGRHVENNIHRLLEPGDRRYGRARGLKSHRAYPGVGLMQVPVGCGAVLFLAITDLRRRFDVATALGVPVSVSRTHQSGAARLPHLRAVDARRLSAVGWHTRSRRRLSCHALPARCGLHR